MTARMPIGSHPPSPGKAILILLGILVVFDVDALLTRAYLLEAFKIPAGSMIPTVLVGDHLFVDKRAVSPKRGDVIVFRYPKDPTKDFIKRVIAVGGDTVEWREGIPLINGRAIDRKPIAGNCG